MTFLNASNSNVSTKENLEESSPSEDEASEAHVKDETCRESRAIYFHSSTFQEYMPHVDEACSFSYVMIFKF